MTTLEAGCPNLEVQRLIISAYIIRILGGRLCEKLT